MDRSLATVIGMSMAYVVSFGGLLLAWWSWRKRGPHAHRHRDEHRENEHE